MDLIMCTTELGARVIHDSSPPPPEVELRETLEQETQ